VYTKTKEITMTGVFYCKFDDFSIILKKNVDGTADVVDIDGEYVFTDEDKLKKTLKKNNMKIESGKIVPLK
jgi:hypothetical protein